ncbi:hypothetical protein LUZ61_015945 [Rhynchospora tenuis]|uniref:NB-ARC domain-containing protein n=1 Tax=Rhynchospora tenuis TaxID=198213 RepID=A0AAD5Z4K8_9POAL|nr:hypothetical protein LUZ61_015945 [Rhynchospora tenuis]
MLSVSQQYSLIDLVTKILREVFDVIKNLKDADSEKPKELELVNNFDDNEPKKQDMGVLISRLRKMLSGMRYLIILDDVWVVELWDQLKYALPDDKNGSRVMMTSRIVDVAKSADSRMEPYMPNLLNDEESCDLLLRKALQNQEVNEVECPIELLELAKELSKKCKGLPLALIVLGGILSTRDQTHHDWKKVLDTMDWHQEGKDCMNVLTMSYEDMPYYLKPCFIYLSSFPEDYEISARILMNYYEIYKLRVMIMSFGDLTG